MFQLPFHIAKLIVITDCTINKVSFYILKFQGLALYYSPYIDEIILGWAE